MMPKECREMAIRPMEAAVKNVIWRSQERNCFGGFRRRVRVRSQARIAGKVVGFAKPCVEPALIGASGSAQRRHAGTIDPC